MLTPAIDDYAVASSYEVPVLCHPCLNPAANPATHLTCCPLWLPGGSWMLSEKLSEEFRIQYGCP